MDFRLVEHAVRFMDVTIGLAAILFAGRLEQHPRLNLIGATAGGAIGIVAPRLDAAYAARTGRFIAHSPSDLTSPAGQQHRSSAA
jgi:hypothetical protein